MINSKMLIRLLVFFLFSFSALFSHAQAVKVGYLVNDQIENRQEIQKSLDFIRSLPGYMVETVPVDGLDEKDLEELDQLWYHRPDSSAVSAAERKIGAAVRKFVKNGGKLLLTMDAVKLLNTWGIEETPVTDLSVAVKDHGFGRKLGFHAFRKHPLFKGLHGGAYIWHAKEDHTLRKLGFFEDALPKGPDAKVIGIDWAYITFHEDRKLIWEYSLGDGKILAVGAYIYFAQPNFNRMHLHRFLRNSFEYLKEGSDEDEMYFWTYQTEDPKEVRITDEESSYRDVSTSSWHLPATDFLLSRKNATDNYWDLPGSRLLLMGKEKGGFDELWAHPFMAFRDYRPGIKINDSDTVIWLNTLTPHVEFTPGVFLRTYRFGENVLKEFLTVSEEGAGMVIHYEWKGDDPVQLFITAASNLRFMWPYSANATGTIGYQWSEGLNALVVTDLKTKKMNSIIGFNESPKNKDFGAYEKFTVVDGDLEPVLTEKNQISAGFIFDLSENENFDVIIAAGVQEMEDLVEVYKNLADNPNSLVEHWEKNYEDINEDVLKIKTPDPVFNEGFKWALAGAETFMVETPGIGKSLVAGYGTTASGWGGGHEISGRPGYAWYFGRDAQWSGFALNSYGDFENVKEVLKTFNKFQNINGKIFHELTTSGSVHYDASDATPLYILLASHYLRASGDLDFIKETWDHIEKAIEYCYSTDTDGDGYIENTNVGHGWVEGGALFGAHTTFYLAGVWAAALRESAYLANLLGKPRQAERYRKDFEKVRLQLNRDFWNEEREFFNYGMWKDGSFNEEITVLPAVPIYFETIEPQKAKAVTKVYSNNNFSSDWGVRILGSQSESFNPSGYHVGSVWPLFTGWASLSEYNTGRYTQGFTHIMNNLKIYKFWDLGSIEEVLHGITFRPSGVTHNQAWSQTMVLQPILEGMLGFEPDALNDRLNLSPRLPWDWETFSFENLHMGDHYLNMDYERNNKKSVYTFDHRGEVALFIDFSPVFPEGTVFGKVFLNGKKTDYTLIRKGEGIGLFFEKIPIKEKMTIEVAHQLGVGVIPAIPELNPGEKSEGLRIIDTELEDNQYIITIEGRGGTTKIFKIFSPTKPVSVEGARYLSQKDDIHQLQISFDGPGKDYQTKKVKVVFD